MKWFRRQAPDPQICPTCGKPHIGLPTDFSYLLPDVIWALPTEERQAHLDWSTDICGYQNRWYVRGVFETPFQFQAGKFGWGLWCEVPEATIAHYRQIWEIDGSAEPRQEGILANDITFFGQTLGLPVEIQFGPADKRPLFFAVKESTHALAAAQRHGLTADDYHAILAWNDSCRQS